MWVSVRDPVGHKRLRKVHSLLITHRDAPGCVGRCQLPVLKAALKTERLQVLKIRLERKKSLNSGLRKKQSPGL